MAESRQPAAAQPGDAAAFTTIPPDAAAVACPHRRRLTPRFISPLTELGYCLPDFVFLIFDEAISC